MREWGTIGKIVKSELFVVSCELLGVRSKESSSSHSSLLTPDNELLTTNS